MTYTKTCNNTHSLIVWKDKKIANIFESAPNDNQSEAFYQFSNAKVKYELKVLRALSYKKEYILVIYQNNK